MRVTTRQWAVYLNIQIRMENSEFGGIRRGTNDRHMKYARAQVILSWQEQQHLQQYPGQKGSEDAGAAGNGKCAIDKVAILTP